MKKFSLLIIIELTTLNSYAASHPNTPILASPISQGKRWVTEHHPLAEDSPQRQLSYKRLYLDAQKNRDNPERLLGLLKTQLEIEKACNEPSNTDHRLLLTDVGESLLYKSGPIFLSDDVEAMIRLWRVYHSIRQLKKDHPTRFPQQHVGCLPIYDWNVHQQIKRLAEVARVTGNIDKILQLQKIQQDFAKETGYKAPSGDTITPDYIYKLYIKLLEQPLHSTDIIQWFEAAKLLIDQQPELMHYKIPDALTQRYNEARSRATHYHL